MIYIMIVVRTVEEAANEQYSYIICAAKCLPDVHPTSDILAPLLNSISTPSATSIVLLQNGVGIEDDIFEALLKRGLNSPVISGCAWVDVTAVDDGKTITQHGNERLVIGYHKPPAPSSLAESASKAALDHLFDIWKTAGTGVEISEIDVARWRKVLWYVICHSPLSRRKTQYGWTRNASFSTVCTLTRARVGEVLAVPEARASLREIMEEVLLVAHASLPDDDTVRSVLHATVAQDIVDNENPASGFKPSMLVDLEAGRPIEVEAIVGGIIRRAREKDIAAPQLDLIYSGLKVIQRGLIKARFE